MNRIVCAWCFFVQLVGLLAAFGSAAAEKPWDAMPYRECREIVTPAGEFTPYTEAALTWLVGYVSGLQAAIQDERMKTLSDPGSLKIGPMVLAHCAANPDEGLIWAATEIVDGLINSLPGRPIILKFELPPGRRGARFINEVPPKN